jgi:hypothetical protein
MICQKRSLPVRTIMYLVAVVGDLFSTYIITDGFRAIRTVELESVYKAWLSLSGGVLAGVSAGGGGKESRSTDSESGMDEATLLGGRGCWSGQSSR